ncbi:MAG: glycosyltransferase [Candidatus Margulisbacteria bacterium]|nr:glycosyltransferase [Candidatus Margulisiibacteriota bacterium]
MKILYVAHGNFWGSTWPYAFIDSYIEGTLKGMGHEVKVYDIFSRVRTFDHFFREYAKKRKLTKDQFLAILDDEAGQALPFEVLNFEPDLVLHIVGRLTPRVLKAVKKLNKRTAIWFMDDPQEIDVTSKKAKFYDGVYTIESACLDAYKEAGSLNAQFLPLGCFPAVHKKMEVEDKYKSDICFIGVPFPARVEFFDSLADFLKDYNVKIIGGGPRVGSSKDPWMWRRKLKRLDVLDKFITDEIVFPDEAAKYYNGARINLNVHRDPVDARFSHGNSRGILPRGISGRSFEIAGCAGFQILDDKRSDVGVHFNVGQEVLTFSNLDDLKQKIKYFLKHDAERIAIAEASQKKAYSHHTYEERLKKVLSNH